MDWINLPEIGIKGNSHMMMQDKNNLQIADLIMKWIDTAVFACEPDHPDPGRPESLQLRLTDGLGHLGPGVPLADRCCDRAG